MILLFAEVNLLAFISKAVYFRPEESFLLQIKTKQEETERILDTALHDFPPGYTSADQPVIPEAPSTPELTPNVIKAVEEVLTDLAESKSHVSCYHYLRNF